MRILILDDDDVRHDIWSALFVRAGHEVVEARTIREFEFSLTGERFDLIFLDHDLNDYPDRWQSVTKGGFRQTGKTACHILRALPTSKQPSRVVIHSWNDEGAWAMWDILMNDPLRGFDVIVKPFSEVLWRRHPGSGCMVESMSLPIDEWEKYDPFIFKEA